MHLSIGQEACAAGVALALKKEDIFFGNNRSHGHYLAKGGNIKKMLFEIFGDERGCCRGIGGSMHMLDKKVNFLGSVPILGSAISISSGIALAEKIKKKSNLTVVFIGDGAAEEGSFYETINMAGLYKIPLLIVIEDNKYAVESDFVKRKVKGYNLNNITSGFNALYKRVNGQDFKIVFKETKILKEKIIKNQCVGVLHLDCLRFSKHSGAEVSEKEQKSKYRKNEYNEIIKNDPIDIIKKDLKENGYKKKQILNLEKIFVTKYNSIFNKVFKQIKIR